MKFTKEEIEAIREALETEYDEVKATVNTWKDDKKGILKRIYKKAYPEIIKADKEYLKLLSDLDKRFCLELKECEKRP